jgi:hypothetical protein
MAEQVWVNMYRFILAYCIGAKKVIKCGGKKAFLQKQEFHFRVWEDFYDTTYGVVKKSRAVLDSMEHVFLYDKLLVFHNSLMWQQQQKIETME